MAGTTAGTAGVGGAGTAAGTGGGQAGQGAAGGGGGCPTEYTVASRLVMDVTWEGLLGVNAGMGKVYAWSKVKFTESGSTLTSSTVSCGTVLPELMTNALGGNVKVLTEFPDAGWESPMMPTIMGTGTKEGSMLSLTPGPVLVGLTLADPNNAAWPAAAQIMGLDHDGDGKPGVTAVFRNGNGYGLPPTAALSSVHADKVYIASRIVDTRTAMVDGCPEMYSGTANVMKFDSHTIGCHVEGGSMDCNATQSKFVDDNTPVFKPTAGSGAFVSKVVPDNATCADVRAAVPIP